MCNIGEGLVERTLVRGIHAVIRTTRKFGATNEEIVEQLMEEFQLDKIEAENHLKNVESDNA